MTKTEAYEIIMKQTCKEIETIAENIQKNQKMTSQDLDILDRAYHLKKGMLTCKAMEDAEEYSGISEYRGRAANGRFVSRTSSEENQNGSSFTEGYERGYSEAMSQNNSYSNGFNRGYAEAMSRLNHGYEDDVSHTPYIHSPTGRRW